MPRSPGASVLILLAVGLTWHLWQRLELSGAEMVVAGQMATPPPSTPDPSRATHHQFNHDVCKQVLIDEYWLRPKSLEVSQTWWIRGQHSEGNDKTEEKSDETKQEQIACNLVCRARARWFVCVELVNKRELVPPTANSFVPAKALLRRRCLLVYADSLEDDSWRRFRRQLLLDSFRPRA